MDRGKDCFARYGAKKTGIDDLTEGLGISKSSFYSFFDSKEDLFLQVFKEEKEALRENILENSFLKYRTEPDKAIRAYLQYVSISLIIIQFGEKFSSRMSTLS